MADRIVMEIRQTGPHTFAGFACEGLYGSTGGSKEDAVAQLRLRLPPDLRDAQVEVRNLPVHVQERLVDGPG